ERRQGRWEEAVAHLASRADLDPLASAPAWEAGVTYLYLRRYPDAERYFDRAIAAAPDFELALAFKAALYVLWDGDTTRARRVIETATQKTTLGRLVGFLGPARWLLTSDTARWPALDALTAADLDSDTTYFYVWKVEWNRERGRTALMRAYGDSARRSVMKQLKEHPDDARLHTILAIAYSGMGRPADAIRESERSVELLPISRDAYWGADRRADLALMYAICGERDKAIDELDRLLQLPSPVSLPWLRLDPEWKGLWNEPRFQRLGTGRGET
ncbi:MAG TPA: hypothetical protein VNL37_02595, partial [Candidatus Polarisedimenticolia bacterium]|nr:hypothetical protein [Candidatus Polarisedimenticolia bacterium]